MSRKSKAAEFVQEGYNIKITGRNVEVTEPMKNYAMEKIAKIERFTNKIIDVAVIMDIQKIDHRVDIKLVVDHLIIKGRAACTDMYASIDKAVTKIESQLHRYRERIKDHQAKHISAIDMNINVLRSPIEEEDLLDINGDIEEENNSSLLRRYIPHKIVSKDTTPLRQLNQEEAILKMELSGDFFMIFRSEEDRKLKVIYRRNDGNYGIIEPEA